MNWFIFRTLEHFVKGSDVSLQGLRVLGWLATVRTIMFKMKVGLHVSFDFTFVRIALSAKITNPLCSAHLVGGFGHILNQKLLKL